MTSIAYNTEKFKPAPDSVEVLWDPTHARQASGVARRCGRGGVSYGAIATGQDMNHPADLEKVKAKLLELKPQITTFWSSEDEWNKHVRSRRLRRRGLLERLGRALQERNFKLPVDYVVPKEGGIGWFDGLTIATDAPNPDGAHEFINFMVDPDILRRMGDQGRRAGLRQCQGQ